jgi:hypothetical protein
MQQASTPEQPQPRQSWESPRITELARLTQLTLATGFAPSNKPHAGSTVIP